MDGALIPTADMTKQVKWLIRPDLTPVSVALSDQEYFYSFLGCQSIAALPPTLTSLPVLGAHLYTWVEKGTVRVRESKVSHDGLGQGWNPDPCASHSSPSHPDQGELKLFDKIYIFLACQTHTHPSPIAPRPQSRPRTSQWRYAGQQNGCHILLHL